MDKIRKIKRLVESSLNTSFGGDILIKEIQIVPTQKYDDKSNKWIPDSHAVFLTIKDNRRDEPDSHIGFLDDPCNEVTKIIEDILGFDSCVAVC